MSDDTMEERPVEHDEPAPEPVDFHLVVTREHADRKVGERIEDADTIREMLGSGQHVFAVRVSKPVQSEG